MKNLIIVFGFVFTSYSFGLSQMIVSEEPMTIENGRLRCRTVVVGFNQNIIPTPSGVSIVDTLHYPIQHSGVRSLLRQLSSRYGIFSIRKSIPRAVWGDTLARNRRTGWLTRVPDQSQGFRITFAQPVPVDSVLSLFSALPVVRYAEEPVSVAFLSTNDPLFSQQYNLQLIKAEQAWPISAGSPSIRLAVIDAAGTGLTLNDHPDLTGRFASGFGIEGAGGHSFLVTGVAGAATNNGIGIASLAYNVSLIDYHLNFYGQSGSYLAGLIDEAANPNLGHGNANVINFSFLTLKYVGGHWCPHVPHEEVSNAIKNAIGQGVVCVAAVGNNPSLYPSCGLSIPYGAYPANDDGVIAVSGTDESDQFNDQWNYLNTSVAAPGVNILTTDPDDSTGYHRWDGTSFSSPQVAGLAALILSVNSSLEPETVREYICRTADKVDAGRYPYLSGYPYGSYNSRLGYGRINAFRALSLANGVPSPPQSVSLSSNNGQYGNVRVSWNANSEPDVVSYEVSRSVSEYGNTWVVIAPSVTGTYYVDPDYLYAPQGGDFHLSYRVRAQDAAPQFSNYSSVVSVRGEDAHKVAAANSITEFSLQQNYPNPFNPSTQIKYSIPSEGHITLKIFDVLGKEIQTLVNETRTQGDYKVEFNADRFAGGVYIYKLSHGGQTLIRKMLLTK